MWNSQAFKYYLDPRVIRVFILGISSGFPWVIIGSALSLWLQESGLSRSEIGYAGAIFGAYSINFLWSPFIDRIGLKTIGNRKGWILLCQLLILSGCIAASFFSPETSLKALIFTCLGIAIVSATQDIAIDALRIDFFDENENQELTAAAAAATSGWWTGYAGLGFIPLWLSDQPAWNWNQVYIVLGLMMLPLIIASFTIKEPKTNRENEQAKLEKKALEKITSLSQKPIKFYHHILAWLFVTIVEPVADFFKRNGFGLALSLLLFIFLFKIGEAFLGRMSIVFYKELGFTNTDIGFYSKMINWWVTIIFSIFGGLFSIKFGIVRGLMIGGIAMAASNLMFALMSYVGPSKALFATAVIIDGFTSAWSTVAFVAFLSLLCNRTFTASQYALMASLGSFGRTALSSFSGLLVDKLDGNWALFFIITALMVVPSLLLLYRISDQIKAIEKQQS